MSQIDADSNSCYILEFLNTDAHSHTGEFVDTMYSILPYITKPTRKTSATLIDTIFSNGSFVNVTLSGVLDRDITDHLPAFHVIFSSSVKNDVYHRTARAIEDKVINKFISMVTNHDYGHVVSPTVAQEAYTQFHETVTVIYNKYFLSAKKILIQMLKALAQ